MLKGGSAAVLGTSAWTVVDLKERSIYRGDLGFDPSFHYPEDTLPFCSKIIVPREIEQVNGGAHKVQWSDLDTNGHANNCAYTQWALDLLPIEYVKTHLLRDVQVNYHREAHYGEQVDLFLAHDENKWFITGKTGELTCFVECLEFD